MSREIWSCVKRNLAYRRHWISKRVQIVAPLQKQTEIDKKGPKNMCHVSGVRCHMSHFKCQVSGVRCQVSGVTYHLLPVSCQLSLAPTAVATEAPPAKSSNRLFRKDPKNAHNTLYLEITTWRMNWPMGRAPENGTRGTRWVRTQQILLDKRKFQLTADLTQLTVTVDLDKLSSRWNKLSWK